MRWLAFGSFSTAMLLLCTYLFTVGVANNNALRRTTEVVRIGDSYQKCQTRWKSEPGLYVECDKPTDGLRPTKHVVMLQLRNHPILDEEAYAYLEFTDDKLTGKYCNDFWRPITGHRGIFRTWIRG